MERTASPLIRPSILLRSTYDGDANLDGKVDISDLYILATNFNASSKTWVQGDFDGDGDVDAADLGILAAHWQAGTGNSVGASSGYVWGLL